MQEWVYPLNVEAPDPWGYDVGVLEMFSGPEAAGVHSWRLGSCFNLVTLDDRIWVYGTAPQSRIIAAGTVLSNPRLEPDDGRWYIDVRWDRRLTRFLLRDTPPADVLEIRTQTVRRMRDTESSRLGAWRAEAGAPQPEEMPRGRSRHLQEVTQRQGQRGFRQALLVAYEGRCAISGCHVDAALQAAHIERYEGPATNVVSNGLLLRADLHNLFDAGLMWIDGTGTVRISSELRDSQYRKLDGKRLRKPQNAQHAPDKEALRWHRENVAWGLTP